MIHITMRLCKTVGTAENVTIGMLMRRSDIVTFYSLRHSRAEFTYIVDRLETESQADRSS